MFITSEVKLRLQETLLKTLRDNFDQLELTVCRLIKEREALKKRNSELETELEDLKAQIGKAAA